MTGKYLKRGPHCVVDGCADKVLARQMCDFHYRSSRDGRSRSKSAKPTDTIQERLERHTERDPNSGCWLWFGSVASRYGRIAYKGKYHTTHRLAWELANRPLKPGEVVCHRCDTTVCLNPAHLFVGTQADNMADMVAKGRARPRGLNHGEFTVRSIAA